MEEKIIYLRIDVDFNIGLIKGVPFILDVLKRTGSLGTFFVVMGPDTLYKHLTRFKRKDYKKRFIGMNIAYLVANFGVAFLKSKFLGQMVGPGNPDVLRRIIDNGCEIGIHGYDHADWADRCFELSPSETINQMDKAKSQYKKLFPEKDWVWGAPNWRCNSYMFDYLQKNNVPYSSDVRGIRPFYPVTNDLRTSVLQFPISLPCLHELVYFGIPKEHIPALMLECATARYNLWCIHDYYEGILEKGLFIDVIHRLVDEGFKIRPLALAYDKKERFKPTESEIYRIQVPGGVEFVSCQKEFLEDNYFSILDNFM